MVCSVGGWVAIKFYEVYPDNIKRLVFVGAMPKFAKSKEYPHGLDIEKMRKLEGQVESAYPNIINIFFRSLFTKEERETRRFKWMQIFRKRAEAPIKQALIEYLDVLEREDLRHVLMRIKIPIQFINGKEDEICTRDTVKFLKTMAPHARFDDFDKCGHFPFLSKPYEFNQRVEEFLKETTL